jgi:hypothetical protein
MAMALTIVICFPFANRYYRNYPSHFTKATYVALNQWFRSVKSHCRHFTTLHAASNPVKCGEE